MLELTARARPGDYPTAARLLDIRCGAGNCALKIFHYIADIHCDLVDQSAPMLERAVQRISDTGSGKVQTFQMVATQPTGLLKAIDPSFDKVRGSNHEPH